MNKVAKQRPGKSACNHDWCSETTSADCSTPVHTRALPGVCCATQSRGTFGKLPKHTGIGSNRHNITAAKPECGRLNACKSLSICLSLAAACAAYHRCVCADACALRQAAGAGTHTGNTLVALNARVATHTTVPNGAADISARPVAQQLPRLAFAHTTVADH